MASIAQNETLHFAVGQSSLGAVLAAASAKGVVAVLLGDDLAQFVQNLQQPFPPSRTDRRRP